MHSLTQEDIEALIAALPGMSPKEQEALLTDLERVAEDKRRQTARDDFLAFCHYVCFGFLEGAHHRFMKPILHRVRDGTEIRVTISMPPRFGKSFSIAYLFVAWYLGHNPTHQIIMVTHTATLSESFGRQVRDLIDTTAYRELFPDTVVAKDKAAAGNWMTTVGGKYLAIGIGANVAGHGAHLLIADDLVSENAVMSNPETAFDNAWKYCMVGPLQRLMPGGRIIMIGTRWGKLDPIGKALAWAEDNPSSPQWLEVRFPAILPSGRSLWPEQWPVEQLEAKRASMLGQFWAAQYMQSPTNEEGALIKREWWQVWKQDLPPDVEFVIQTWDTAHEAKNYADYSACTTWGIWTDEKDVSNIILLDAVRGRWEFPELKKKVLEKWKQWDPEALIVEKKAAGAPLIQELRRMNIVVQEISPSRGSRGMSNDKRARMNAIAGVFEAGRVWIPDKRWAWEVVDEVAEFPFGANDDRCLVANTKIILATGGETCILQLRSGDWVATPTGACEVVYCEISNPMAVVIEVQLSDGNVIRGTAEHPVYAPVEGAFVPLGALKLGDELCAPKNTSKSFSIVELITAGIRTAGIHPLPNISTENVLVKTKPYTVRCGLMQTARYLKIMLFTIRMKTPQTMCCPIWSALPEKSMVSGIVRKTLHLGCCIKESGARLIRESVRWLNLRSMLVRNVEGCLSLCRQTGLSSAPQNATTFSTRAGQVRTHVSFAQRCLYLRLSLLSVLKTAGKRISRRAKPNGISVDIPQEPQKSTSGCVPSAEGPLAPRCLANAYVPMRAALNENERPFVVGVKKVERREPVYALKVRGNPVFYANGFLVHNCDCTQMAIARYRTGGFISTPTDYDEDAPGAGLTRRQKAYY